MKEAVSFAAGKERIFGAEDPSKAMPNERRGGKRIFQQSKPTPSAVY